MMLLRASARASLGLPLRALVKKEKQKAEEILAAERHRLQQREARARAHMWRAVESLPADLQPEAMASPAQPVPDELLFHNLYQKDWMASLNEEEEKRLQVFWNLMYVRYPHLEEKRRSPSLFFIPETQKVSRQRELAMLNRRRKLKK